MKRLVVFIYSILLTFNTLSAQIVGDNTQGGVVFYMNASNTGGLVALKTAHVGAVNASWGCRGIIVNAGGIAIGTGASNTANILSGCSTVGIFADLISQLTHGGYSDWYMPSKDELQEIRDVFWNSGNWSTYFAVSPNGHYDHITSSENDSETAWRLNCTNNVWEANWKDNTNFGTIPVRAFGTMMTIMGCTDPTACNYDVLANNDDGSCILTDGCTDPAAFNYDASANCDDGSCIATVFGCMDSTQFNYNSLANTDNGSCTPFLVHNITQDLHYILIQTALDNANIGDT
ncbi:MAG: hypothetical protein VYB55_00485, partial [Bacteroidota bacterium]|nr:hypothetical protein [Bacteroidota bacterium]